MGSLELSAVHPNAFQSAGLRDMGRRKRLALRPEMGP
jgi:hypothetical protein